MPVGAYYKGHGHQVLEKMLSQYGKKKGKEVFYATARSKKMEPKKK